MSVDIFNRLRILEKKVEALEGLASPTRLKLLDEILAKHESQACEERPRTLSLKNSQQKAGPSHA